MKIACLVLIANLELAKIWSLKTKYVTILLMYVKTGIFVQALILSLKPIAEKYLLLMMELPFHIQQLVKEDLRDGILAEWPYIILVTLLQN